MLNKTMFNIKIRLKKIKKYIYIKDEETEVGT